MVVVMVIMMTTNDDDDDDGTDTGTLELKREIRLKSARTWLWSFKGYEELTYNF